MQPTNDDHNAVPQRRFMRRVRKGRLKTIAILPSLITLINGVTGFVAISLAARGAQYFAVAGYLLFLAMIADMLDGRVARMSHATSSFGGQLDSLCDILSFGVAPAFLALHMMLHYHSQLIGAAEPLFGDLFVRFIWLTCVGYLCCCAIRLARFNVENVEDETAHMTFTGLPSPAAAGVLASLVVFFEHMLIHVAPDTRLFTVLRWSILYILPVVTLGAGVLMVSRIRYPHVVNQYLRGRKPIIYLAWAGVLFGVIFLFGLQLALVISFSAFALSGLVRWIWLYTTRHRLFKATPQKTEPPPTQS